MDAEPEKTLKSPETKRALHQTDGQRTRQVSKPINVLDKPVQLLPRINKATSCFKSCIFVLILVAATSQSNFFFISTYGSTEKDMSVDSKIILLTHRLGYVTGIFLGTFLMNLSGRLITMMTASILLIIFSLTYIIFPSALTAYFVSLPAGLSEVAIAHYIMEVSPQNWRPMITSCFVISEAIGVMMQSLIYSYVNESVEIAMTLTSIISVAFLVVFFFGMIVESPRWLALKKDETKMYEAHSVLYKKQHNNVSEVLPYPVVSSNYAQRLSSITISLCIISVAKTIFFQTHFKLVMVGILHHFSAIFTIGFATSFGYVTGPLISHRKLVIVSTLFIMANYTVFFLISGPDKRQDGNIVNVVCSLLVSGGFASGFEQILLIKMTVFYPMASKTVYHCTWPFVARHLGSLVLLIPTKDAKGINFICWIINAIACAACCILLYFYIPETEGKTLEQIHESLGGKKEQNGKVNLFSPVNSPVLSARPASAPRSLGNRN